jgi:hypothetical protein
MGWLDRIRDEKQLFETKSDSLSKCEDGDIWKKNEKNIWNRGIYLEKSWNDGNNLNDDDCNHQISFSFSFLNPLDFYNFFLELRMSEELLGEIFWDNKNMVRRKAS